MTKLDVPEKKLLREEARKHRVSDPMDPNFCRVKYVRYADDFLISILGPRKLAVHIKDIINTFLDEQLSLKLSLSKTFITKASKKPAKFLGAEIMWKTP